MAFYKKTTCCQCDIKSLKRTLSTMLYVIRLQVTLIYCNCNWRVARLASGLPKFPTLEAWRHIGNLGGQPYER